MNKAYILTGSNVGDRLEYIEKASVLLAASLGKIILQSPVYETEPWGLKEQPLFLNQAIQFDTILNAEEVLINIINIEKALERNRVQKWGSRTIDIDILYFNREIIVTDNLKIPHAEIHNRKFVLIPLVSIDPDYIHPVFNVSNKILLDRCRDELKVYIP